LWTGRIVGGLHRERRSNTHSTRTKRAKTSG
jgi:hypothetical protein